MNILANTTIILIETSHPGNIGSVARFMKNMGFENLALVNPLCEVNNLSMALSSNAKSIVENAKIYNTLDEALASFNCVIGTTARNRGIPVRILSPANILDQLNKDNIDKVAILMRNESRGLTNSQINKCNYVINIPTNSNYSSLNVASALNIILYELSKRSNSFSAVSEGETVTSQENFSGMIEHFYSVSKQIGIMKDDRPMLRSKLNHIFKKSKLTDEEINILRGFLSAVEKHSQ